MLINDHFHSICSFDADYPLTEMCGVAWAAGVTELCLTDHCDLIDEHGRPDDSFDWGKEDEQLRLARERYAGKLHIRRGVELGEAILRPQAAERVLSEPGIDFVLGSMHCDRNGTDYYYMKFTDRRQCEAMLEAYLQCLLELSRTDWLDSLAHLSYPLRYMRRDGMDMDLKAFDDLVEEILKTLIHRGKALELNTSGYRNNGGEPMPPESVLRRYRALGGDLLTIGSDAHEPEHMASGLAQGMELLRACGFRYITIYEDRKPKQITL